MNKTRRELLSKLRHEAIANIDDIEVLHNFIVDCNRYKTDFRKYELYKTYSKDKSIYSELIESVIGYLYKQKFHELTFWPAQIPNLKKKLRNHVSRNLEEIISNAASAVTKEEPNTDYTESRNADDDATFVTIERMYISNWKDKFNEFTSFLDKDLYEWYLNDFHNIETDNMVDIVKSNKPKPYFNIRFPRFESKNK